MSSAKTVITRNPATGEKLREYSFMDEVELEKVMARAQQAFGSWSTLKMEDRIQALDKLKASFLSHRGELGSLISTEMGKPLQQSFAEIDKSMDLITYCNKQAPKSLNPERRSDYTVLYQPLGVLYGIMPWNFPIWQAMRFCVPALLSGNTILLKPAENVAGSGQMMEDVFSAVPELRHVFNNIRIDHATSDSVIADPRVRGVSFTGSTNAGRHIAKTAGQFLKKNVLELGGNDAYIVFADADVPAAVKKIAQVRLLNAGQSCISAKRLIIEEKVVAEFMIGLQKELAQVRIGNPLDEGVALGPVARRDQQETLHKQLKKSLDEGAEIFYQVPLPEDLPKDSCFVAPVILHKVKAGSTAFREEFFGPVFTVISFKDEEGAIRLANESPFGLGGAVFSQDATKVARVARRMDTGSVALNDFFRSSPERPFGGVKDSGYGRELGPEGFHEFVNVKVIVGDA